MELCPRLQPVDLTSDTSICSVHLWREWSVIFQVLVECDLLKFVNCNILANIDAPTVLVVMLPFDALSHEKAPRMFHHLRGASFSP